MAWTYHDFEEQTTIAAKIARLEQHLTEVQAKILEDVSLDGSERSSRGLISYREGLIERLEALQEQSGEVVSDDARSSSSFTRGIPTTRATA